jgi:hypothetical protein
MTTPMKRVDGAGAAVDDGIAAGIRVVAPHAAGEPA